MVIFRVTKSTCAFCISIPPRVLSESKSLEDLYKIYVNSLCSFINGFLERSEQNGQSIDEGWESRLDIESGDIVIKGSSNTRISRKQVSIYKSRFAVKSTFKNVKALAEKICLRYMQRWGKDLLRHRLDWQMTEDGVSSHPRHIRTSYCACQYVEEILLSKIPKGPKTDQSCCVCCSSINRLMSRLGFNVC